MKLRDIALFFFIVAIFLGVNVVLAWAGWRTPKSSDYEVALLLADLSVILTAIREKSNG